VRPRRPKGPVGLGGNIDFRAQQVFLCEGDLESIFCIRTFEIFCANVSVDRRKGKSEQKDAKITKVQWLKKSPATFAGSGATILSSPAIGRNAQGRVASPRRPLFAVGGLGTPVRSEIGPYHALAERATMLKHPGQSFVTAPP
jgi:hypothetical protein